MHLRERLMRDLRVGGTGFGGKFARYEVWQDMMQRKKDDWLTRCGDNVLFSAYRWAHMADPNALLSTVEGNILTTQTLTNAEAYHNLLWEMYKNKDVPLGAIGVRANFSGEVDASTVKHRLDVLQEVGLPVYITDFSIAGLDPAKHAYELEKFLRIAFSHEAVAGITLGDLWDKGNERPSSGLYTTSKQPKPAASKIEQLWTNEWTTHINSDLTKKGMLDFEGFYGTYQYEVRSGTRVCAGTVNLPAPKHDPTRGYWAGAPPQEIVLQCAWKGHFHLPVGVTPAIIAFLFVACLLGCYKKNQEMMQVRRQQVHLPEASKKAGGRREERDPDHPMS